MKFIFLFFITSDIILFASGVNCHVDRVQSSIVTIDKMVLV